MAELNRLLKFLNSKDRARIEIYGHTDDQGPVEYNRQLSWDRAKYVTEYLILNGIDANRMKYFGFGKSMPLIDSINETARSLNRRVEVKLMK